MWMSNVVCLYNLFRQYSGVAPFSNENSTEENKHNFRSYDLSEFIRLLQELSVVVFHVNDVLPVVRH